MRLVLDGADGDADAGRGRDLVTVHLVSGAERGADAPGKTHGVLGRVDLLGDDGELVAAEPADEIDIAGILLQARGDFLKQRVARGVAERVVDVLEAIEVEAEHRHEVAVALGAGHRTFQILVELHAVGQAGQRIVHGEEADLVLGQPALADAPRGDRRRHGEAHDDQKAGGQGNDRERQIGERGGRRLVNGEGVDAGELAALHDRDQRKADIPLVGEVGKLDTTLACRSGERALDVALAKCGAERLGREIAADGERGPFGRQDGEAIEAADELAACLVDIAQQPAAGEPVETVDQAKSICAETRLGRKRDLRAVGALGEIAKPRFIQHMHVFVEHALRRAGLAQTVVDFASPGQRGFAGITAKDVIDRGSAGQNAGNDGE